MSARRWQPRWILAISLIFLLPVVGCASPPAQAQRGALLPDFADLAERVLPAVVKLCAAVVALGAFALPALSVIGIPLVPTAVWLGYPESTERKMDAVHGRAVTGGSFPATIWQRRRTKASDDRRPASSACCSVSVNGRT